MFLKEFESLQRVLMTSLTFSPRGLPWKGNEIRRQHWGETRMTTWLVNVSITPALQERVTSVDISFSELPFSLNALWIGHKLWFMTFHSIQHYNQSWSKYVRNGQTVKARRLNLPCSMNSEVAESGFKRPIGWQPILKLWICIVSFHMDRLCGLEKCVVWFFCSRRKCLFIASVICLQV